MKKLAAFILVVIFVLSVVSCTGNQPAKETEKATEEAKQSAEVTEAATEAATEKPQEIVVPDVTLTYVPGDVYANKEALEGTGYREPSRLNLANWFLGKAELDENSQFVIPDEFSLLEGYVLRIPQGKAVMEIGVFKLADKSNAQSVVTMVEKRYEAIKSSDWRLYDDAEGSSAKIIDTGKIEAVGNFVIFTLTNNSEVSMLRAKKCIYDNPAATAAEVYKAITSDIAG